MVSVSTEGVYPTPWVLHLPLSVTSPTFVLPPAQGIIVATAVFSYLYSSRKRREGWGHMAMGLSFYSTLCVGLLFVDIATPL